MNEEMKEVKKIAGVTILIILSLMVSGCQGQIAATLPPFYPPTATPSIDAVVQTAVAVAMAKLPTQQSCQQPCVAPCGAVVKPMPVKAKAGSSTTTTAATSVPPQPQTSTCEGCLYKLYDNLREVQGVKIIVDREGWDGKANGMASYVKVEGGSATFYFELWDPSTSYKTIKETYVVNLGPGTYNLEKIFYPVTGREVNDTLQRVCISPGTTVTIWEHDPPSGITIQFYCDP